MKCAQEMIRRFRESKLEQVPRKKNMVADALAKLSSQKKSTMLGVILLEI